MDIVYFDNDFELGAGESSECVEGDESNEMNNDSNRDISWANSDIKLKYAALLKVA